MHCLFYLLFRPEISSVISYQSLTVELYLEICGINVTVESSDYIQMDINVCFSIHIFLVDFKATLFHWNYSAFVLKCSHFERINNSLLDYSNAYLRLPFNIQYYIFLVAFKAILFHWY